MNILKAWFDWLYEWKESIRAWFDSDLASAFEDDTDEVPLTDPTVLEYIEQSTLVYEYHSPKNVFLLNLVRKGLVTLGEEGCIKSVKFSALDELTEDQIKFILEELEKTAYKETK